MKISRLRIVAIVFGGLSITELALGGDPSGFVIGMLFALLLDWMFSE